MIVKTDAIVLSAMKYRDTSKILRLYTREFGKMSVVVKGARDSKNRFGSALQPMNYVSVVVYKNDNRELQLLTQCDVVMPFRHLSDDMEKMHVAMSVMELVNIVSHDEERNEALFELVINVLEGVNSATKSVIVALYYFETKLFEILGYQPDLQTCLHCANLLENESRSGATLVLTGDGALCSACSEATGRSGISLVALKALKRMQAVKNVASILSLQLLPSVSEEIRRSMQNHMQRHIEGFRGLRSEEVFDAIL